MSLATRCTACGTVFRVVQDQLKISEGWVRCGRCKEVFNALEGLFDLDREAPPPWNPPVPASSTTVDVDLPVGEPADAVMPTAEPTAAPPEEAAVDTGATQAVPADVAATTDAAATADEAAVELPPRPLPEAVAPPESVAPPETEQVVDDAVSRFGPPHEPLADDATATANAVADEAALQEAVDAGLAADEAPAAPAFLREAERRARWQSPRARVALGLAVLALAGLLAAQAAFQLRDTIAAHWPQAAPLLQAACERLGCTLEPLRRIDAIAVESSSLTRAAEPGVDALRLTVVLRNRSDLALATPMVDLSLTDGNGELVARRSLAAADFERAPATLAPASETSLQLAFSTDGRRVAGYTVEIFYP